MIFLKISQASLSSLNLCLSYTFCHVVSPSPFDCFSMVEYKLMSLSLIHHRFLEFRLACLLVCNSNCSLIATLHERPLFLLTRHTFISSVAEGLNGWLFVSYSSYYVTSSGEILLEGNIFRDLFTTVTTTTLIISGRNSKEQFSSFTPNKCPSCGCESFLFVCYFAYCLACATPLSLIPPSQNILYK